MSSCVALECYSLQFVDMFANKAKLWSDASGLEFRFKHPRFLFIYFVALVTTTRRISYAFISDTNKPANSWWYSHLANDVKASYFARVMRLSELERLPMCAGGRSLRGRRFIAFLRFLFCYWKMIMDLMRNGWWRRYEWGSIWMLRRRLRRSYEAQDERVLPLSWIMSVTSLARDYLSLLQCASSHSSLRAKLKNIFSIAAFWIYLNRLNPFKICSKSKLQLWISKLECRLN